MSEPKSDKWLIWSIEHGAWWKPDRNGYTSKFKEAGRYTYEEALELVTHANWNLWNLDKAKGNKARNNMPYEAMVQDDS